MTNKTEMVRVPRELLERVATEANHMLGFTYASNYDQCRDAVDSLQELIAAPAEDARAVGEEPVSLTAVATLRYDGDGGLEADWLLEGGTSELFEGMILLVADNDPTLCEEDGSAEVYRHPQRPVVLPERQLYSRYLRGVIPENRFEVEAYKDGWNACIDELERLNK